MLGLVIGAEALLACAALDVVQTCLIVDDDAEVADEGGCPAPAQVCCDSLNSPLASPAGLLHLQAPTSHQPQPSLSDMTPFDRYGLEWVNGDWEVVGGG